MKYSFNWEEGTLSKQELKEFSEWLRKWQTYGKMPEKPTVTETAQAEAIRHQDAQVDGRAFFQHLETQHPEKYEFGDVIPQQDN